ncbi:hypothetical protein SBFV2_gp28 [Sulfolobales Beppu filamentous virus 2]|uniref:Uncharacterized protein n=1 Tax=Sulfolobales Beppu filamentous virus 2 TaxID=2493123 RepID=A0A3S8NEY1_9VIRU|nr:hypothetical protein HOU84_gp28 [Sulfolobales Beppu filamentous virus 2]AZI75795.1 hypothetical protein SBFV2_gp28 [Sulfolobales Beppu filamentous virus 2]
MEIKRPGIFSDPEEKIFSRKLDKDQFMDEDHYERYQIIYNLRKQKILEFKDYFIIIDEPYKYYVADISGVNLCTYFVVGTDDSGKLFSTFRPVCADDLPKSLDTVIGFRNTLFGFQTHFWEEEKTWYILERDRRVKVRLQGEVIAEMQVADSDNITPFIENPGGVAYIEKKAKEVGNKDLYYAMRNLLPKYIAISIKTSIPYNYDAFMDQFRNGKYHNIITEFLWDAMNVKDKLRIKVGNHIIHARGIRLSSNTFLINPPRMIAFHPYHKKVIFPIHRSVYVMF